VSSWSSVAERQTLNPNPPPNAERRTPNGEW
jgi:hypothetical protein